MAFDGSIKIDSAIDGSGFSSGLQKLGGIAKGTLTAVTGLVAGAAAALGGAAVAGVKYNSQMEQYITSFGTMLGGADKATSMVGDLKKFAAATPFEFSDLAKGTQTLLAFGTSAQDIMPDLQMLGDVSQGNTDRFNALTLAFAQVSSAGKLSGQDLLQFVNAGFNPLQVMAQKTGKSMAELRDEMGKGQISAEDVAQAFKDATGEGGQFYNAMESQSQTFNGQLSTLKDNAMQFLGNITQGFTNSLKDTALPLVNGYLTQLSDAFSSGGVNGVVSALGSVLADAFGQLAQQAPGAINLAVSMIQSFLTGIQQNSGQMATAAFQIVSALANGIITLAPSFVDTAFQLIMSFGQSILDNSQQISDRATDLINMLVNGFVTGLPQMVDMAVKLITALANGLSEHSDQMIAGAQQIITTLANTLINAAPQLASAAVKLMASFYSSLMQQNPPVGIFLTLAGSVKGLQSAFNGLGSAAGVVKKLQKSEGIVSKVGKSFKGAGGNIQSIASGFANLGKTVAGGLLTGIKTLGSGISSLFSLLAANPIVLIVALIAAAIAAIVVLWNTNEGFRNAVTNAWNAILGVSQNVWGAIVNFFTVTIPNAWNSFISFMQQWGPMILAVIAPVFGIPLLIIQHWSQISQFFIALWNGIISFFATAVPAWIASIGLWFQQLPYNLGLALGMAIKAIADFGVNVWNWVTITLPQIIQGIIQWFAQLPGNIWTFLLQVVTNIEAWGSNVWTSATTWIANTINSISQWFQQLPGRIWNWLLNTISQISQWGSNMRSTASSAASDTINAIIGWFAQLPGRVWDGLLSVIRNVGSWGSRMWDVATSAASNVVNGIIGFFSDLPGHMLDIGQNIIYGIWNGITGAASWLKDKVSSFCNNFISGFKEGLGIHSPSRLFRDEIGKMLPPGIAIGFQKATPDALKDMQSQMNGMVSRMQANVSANQSFAFAASGGYSTTVVVQPAPVRLNADARKMGLSTTSTQWAESATRRYK